MVAIIQCPLAKTVHAQKSHDFLILSIAASAV